jgi:hypothetical protein
MKRILIVLFALFSFPIMEFAKFREDVPLGNSPPQIATHQKTAKWPAKSFYQRKAEWQWIIDSTWGPGAIASEKLDIFDNYANLIQTRFPLFYRLNLNWDSLKTNLRSKITSSTSHGAFQSIMSDLMWSLKDGHSLAINKDILGTPLNPGTPLFVAFRMAHFVDVNHFGACLTVNDDGEIFVIKTIQNHPLGLEAGDVILGYEGVAWGDLIEELINADIPFLSSHSTNEQARKHNLMISAGMNWHMFSIIDIVKYSTGDTLHLSLEPMLQIADEYLLSAEQMDIPGVPKPDFSIREQGSYGVIENTNIGYIYIYQHAIDIPKTINQIFQEAVTNLYNADGLIIDLRFTLGGEAQNSLYGGFDLLLNKTIIEPKFVKRCNATDLYSLCDYLPGWWSTSFTPNPNTFFQKPVAILVGPQCGSMGDFTAYKFKNLPNGKFFGKTTRGLMGSIDGWYEGNGYKGWILFTQVEESYHSDCPYQYLSGKDFPIDKEVWLTKEDVANGYDTVVEEAVSWINNLSHSYNVTINKSYTQNEIEFAADVKNPNNHSLSIVADIINNNSVVDSINCSIVGNKISEIWSAPGNSEDFYSVTIRTKDIEDTTVHTLPNIVRFTTAGPIKLDSIRFVKGITNYYNLRPFARNEGTSLTISNAKIQLRSNDPWVTSIAGAITLPSIAPSASVGASSWIAISYYDSIFPGYFNLKAEMSVDGWTYWTDSIRINVITGIEEESTLPTSFKLEQNFPNPFNPTTTIGFGIPEKGNVRLSVLNILGEEIKVLLNEEKGAGYHSVGFNGSDLPSGVYFYKLVAKDFVSTKKMILIK